VPGASCGHHKQTHPPGVTNHSLQFTSSQQAHKRLVNVFITFTIAFRTGS